MTIAFVSVRLLVLCLCVFHVNGRWMPCSLDYCKCEGKKAICYNNGPLLTEIPDISWPSITVLYFQRNLLRNVTMETFKNIYKFQIKHLDLSGNYISFVGPKAFSKLTYLDTLNLCDNGIHPKYLASGLKQFPPSLDYIYLNNMNLSSLPSDIFDGLRNTTVKGIHLTNNLLTEFDLAVTNALTRLTTLNLKFNQISSLKLTRSKTLGALWMTSNRLGEFPEMCPNGSALFPVLWTLSLEFNDITEFNATRFNCLKELTKLFVSGNHFYYIPGDSFWPLTYLHSLNISENTPRFGHLRLAESTFNNSRLTFLNLSRSGIQNIRTYAFSFCPKLRVLDLSHGNHTSLGLSSLLQFSNLRSFSCRNCSLKSLPNVKHMSYLEDLYLDNNLIETLHEHVFDPNTLITHLSLRANRMKTLSSFAITDSLRYNLKYFSVADNPFTCDCRLLWLKHWILSSKELFRNEYLNYTCDTPQIFHGDPILDVGKVSDKRCLFDQSPFTNVVCWVGTVFVLLVVFGLLYKWRWKIRYCCYGRKMTNTTGERRPLLAPDAYVVYSDDDYNSWIRCELMTHIEEQTTLRLSIRQRDFDLKRHKVNNVMEQMRLCRKVVVVLSTSFFRDGDSQEELSLVLKSVDSGLEGVKVVFLEEIDNRYLSSPNCRLLMAAEVFRWHLVEDSYKREQFWRSLRLSLEDSNLHSFS